MKKLITLLVAALSLSTFFPTIALAGSIIDQFSDKGTWVPLGTSNNGSELYVRISDIAAGRSTSRDAKVWWGMDLSRNPDTRKRAFMMLVSYDCVARTSQVIQSVSYYPDGSHTTNTSYSPKEYITPGTFDDTVFSVTCTDPKQ